MNQFSNGVAKCQIKLNAMASTKVRKLREKLRRLAKSLVRGHLLLVDCESKLIPDHFHQQRKTSENILFFTTSLGQSAGQEYSVKAV